MKFMILKVNLVAALNTLQLLK